MSKPLLSLPFLRFKGFYDEWKRSYIGEIFNVNAGGDIKKLNFQKSKNKTFCYPIYSNSLEKRGLYGYSDSWEFSGESITVTGRGEIGHAIYRNEKFTPIIRLLILKPLDNYSARFFTFAINRYDFNIELTGVPQLTKPKISKIKIWYPKDYNEQNKIAKFSSLLDKQISLWERKLELSLLFYRFFLTNLVPSATNKKSTNIIKNRICDLLVESTVKTKYNDVKLASVGLRGFNLRENTFVNDIKYKENYLVKLVNPNDIVIGMGSKQIDLKLNQFNFPVGVSSAYKVFKVKNITPYYVEKFVERNLKYFSNLYMIVSARQGKTIDIQNFLKDYIYFYKNIDDMYVSKVLLKTNNFITKIKSNIEKLKNRKKYYMNNMFI